MQARPFKIFILLILFVIFLKEIRGNLYWKQNWWGQVISYGEPYDFIFIGSSRVGAAIDTVAFTQEWEKLSGKKVKAINLGRGYSTMMQHYLGLKQYFKILKAKSVPMPMILVEAPEGFPFIRDQWFYEDDPSPLVPVMDHDHFLEFWKSETPFMSKIDFSLRYFSVSYDRFRAYQPSWFARLEEIFIKPEMLDIADRAGIRKEKAFVNMAKALAKETLEKEVKNQEPYKEPASQTLVKIDQLAKLYGTDFIPYFMPLSEVQKVSEYTPIRIKDRNRIKSIFAIKNWQIVNLDFPIRKGDFPDDWHLVASRAPDFSKALSKAVFNYKVKLTK